MFEQVVQLMAEMGLFQLFFPWLLVLAVTYGVVQQYEIFGDDPAVNGTVALAVAFIAIGGAYLFLPDQILTHFAASITFLVFAVIGLMILMAVAGIDLDEVAEGGDAIYWIIFSLIIIAMILALSATVDLGSISADRDIFDEIVMPILVLVFLIIIVALTVTGDD